MIPHMKKRTGVIGVLLSLLPIGQPLVIGTGTALTSTVVMFAAHEKAQAESSSYYYNRGNDKYDAGDYYGAISDYSRAIEITPRDADAYYNRGNAKGALEDYYGAIADLNKAIEINPRYINAYYNRGTSKEKLGDIKGACADWREAYYRGDQDAKQLIRNQC